ncbi:hypothetical protein, partial [Yoonia sp.]|uniref:hypothetical protein n=1 Tax=Yoonia sp. TaxID=2212373 RepID=UPI003F6CA1B0
EHRRKSYSNYFAASYELGRELMHRLDDPRSEIIVEAYEKFQKASPDFLLHASPIAIIISDEFYKRFLALREADRNSWTPEGKQHLVKQLSDALGTLREQLKSELFLTQPRFQYERLRHRMAWNRLNRGAEASDEAVASAQQDQ